MIDNPGLTIPDFVNGVEGGQVIDDVNVSHICLQLELLGGNQVGVVDEEVCLDRVRISSREYLDFILEILLAYHDIMGSRYPDKISPEFWC